MEKSFVQHYKVPALSAEFIYLFSLQKLNTVVVKWVIHMKSLVAVPGLLVLHVSIMNYTTAQIEVAWKSLGDKLQKYLQYFHSNIIYIAICIWAYICKTKQ